MPRFPAAFCYTCDRFLSPQSSGSRSDAEKAKRSHERHRLLFEGHQHQITIFDDRSDFEMNGPSETEALAG